MKFDKKTVVGLVLAVLVGVGAYVTNGGDVMSALKIALDKDAAVAECKVLLSEQPTYQDAVETPAQ